MRRRIKLTNFIRESEAIPALSVLNEGQNMDTNIKKIRALNDNLRQNFTSGRVLITRGVAELPIYKQLNQTDRNNRQKIDTL